MSESWRWKKMMITGRSSNISTTTTTTTSWKVMLSNWIYVSSLPLLMMWIHQKHDSCTGTHITSGQNNEAWKNFITLGKRNWRKKRKLNVKNFIWLMRNKRPFGWKGNPIKMPQIHRILFIEDMQTRTRSWVPNPIYWRPVCECGWPAKCFNLIISADILASLLCSRIYGYYGPGVLVSLRCEIDQFFRRILYSVIYVCLEFGYP